MSLNMFQLLQNEPRSPRVLGQLPQNTLQREEGLFQEGEVNVGK